MKNMSCTGSGRKSCLPGDSMQSSSKNGECFQLEAELTAKIVEEWDSRFSRIETILESLSKASSTSGLAQDQLKNGMERILTSLAGGSSVTMDFDKLLTSRLQPLTLALDNIQHQSHATDVKVKREEITYSQSGSMGTIPPEGNADNPRAKAVGRARLSEGDPNNSNLQAFREATDTIIVELKSHNEKRQSAFIEDLKTHQDEAHSKLQVSLDELKQHLKTHDNGVASEMQSGKVGQRQLEPVFDLQVQDQTEKNPEAKVKKLITSDLMEHRKEGSLSRNFTNVALHSFKEGELPEVKMKTNESASAMFLHDSEVSKRPYSVEDYYKTSGFSQWLARDHIFQGFTLFMVCLNTIWIGYDADHGESNLYRNPTWHQLVSQIFNGFFFFEWIVRFLAFRACSDAVKDGWFQFDTFLVWTMVLDAWALQTIIHVVVSDGNRKVSVPTQPFRALRILKLSRMAKLMNNLPELVTMIKGLFRSCRAILATIILVLLMNYVWAIIMHMILKDQDELNRTLYKQSYMDFTSVGNSMWILLQDGTLMLDNAAPLMTELLYHKNTGVSISGVLFTFYSLISALLLLQMLIGVLCDVVAKVNHEQRDSVAIGLVKQELLEKLQEYDKDGDEHLTSDDLFHVMSDPRSLAVLKHLNINRGFLYQLQCTVFAHAERMSIKTALEMILLCRSDNPATVEALAGGFCFVGTELHMLQTNLSEMMEIVLSKL